MDGLKTGNDALKKANEMFSIEEIEAIMDDTAEAVAKQREIDDLISGQLTPEDEDDVLKELEALADLEEAEATNASGDDVKLPDVPTADLPGKSCFPHNDLQNFREQDSGKRALIFLSRRVC